MSDKIEIKSELIIPELRLSVSKTKCYSGCKKQFYFNYIAKLPKKTRSYHITGTFVHATLEWFHNQYIQGCLLPYHLTMKDAFAYAWKEYKDKMTPEMKTDCFNLVNDYLKSISNTKMNVLAMEKRFSLLLEENVVLNGAIDMIKLDDDGVLHVADFKTTKNKKYLINDHFQLLTYAFVLYMEDPTITKIRASYILLRHQAELSTVEFNLDEILKIKDVFLDYAKKIRNETEYEPNPTILCSYCDYLDSCETGQKQSRVFSGEVDW
jgi:CRISPR/Cas system-associated exonuclease Cas4 (RecB family)